MKACVRECPSDNSGVCFTRDDLCEVGRGQGGVCVCENMVSLYWMDGDATPSILLGALLQRQAEEGELNHPPHCGSFSICLMVPDAEDVLLIFFGFVLFCFIVLLLFFACLQCESAHPLFSIFSSSSSSGLGGRKPSL